MADLQTKYTLKQMNDMLEVLDVYDSLKDEAIKKIKAENPK